MARQVSVIGPADATAAQCRLAREVGALLAAEGVAVVCGGGGGVMDAVAAGASAAGGAVIGVLPGPDRGGASPHLSYVLITDLGEARNNVVALSGEAVIAVGGNWGTLSEVALAMRAGVRVVDLGGWRVVDATGDPVGGVLTAAAPAEAVALALRP